MLSFANLWFHVVSAELDKLALHRLVKAYPVLIADISKQGKKNPSKYTESLTALDEYRYEELPRLLAERRDHHDIKNKNSSYLELEELKRLLEWKMFRGVYRPSLRGLVASNSREAAKTVTSEAFTEFVSTAPTDHNKGIQQSLKTLCKLRGVGPATASLILSVAYPNSVAFFADELFAWIFLENKQMLDKFLQQKHSQGTGDGTEGKRVDKIVSIKYSEGEYKSLCAAVLALGQRLQTSDEEISATDIEKAAFVILQGLEASCTDLEQSEIGKKDAQETDKIISDNEQDGEGLKPSDSQAKKLNPQSSGHKSNSTNKVVSKDNANKRRGKRAEPSSSEQASKRKKITSS